MTASGPTIHAAGGVVWRPSAEGIEVLLVHRPRYDDWSFPKGKRDPGESDEACALREVEEEAGLACQLGAELPSTSYDDRFGRPKLVRYWAMQALDEPDFVPGDEVDALAWLSVDEARTRLTYGRDTLLLDAVAEALGR